MISRALYVEAKQIALSWWSPEPIYVLPVGIFSSKECWQQGMNHSNQQQSSFALTIIQNLLLVGKLECVTACIYTQFEQNVAVSSVPPTTTRQSLLVLFVQSKIIKCIELSQKYMYYDSPLIRFVVYIPLRVFLTNMER